MSGVYGAFISDYIARQKSTFTFLDIGANQGIFTLCAAMNPECVRVISFEPNPQTYDFLIRNVEANGAAEKVEAINAAIADSDTVELHIPQGHSGGTSMFGKGRAISVPAIRPDRLDAMIDGRVVAKIDVEGAETIVLSVLEEAGILDRISSVIIEVSEKLSGSRHSNELIDFLISKGWSEYSRAGKADHYDAIYLHPRANEF